MQYSFWMIMWGLSCQAFRKQTNILPTTLGVFHFLWLIIIILPPLFFKVPWAAMGEIWGSIPFRKRCFKIFLYIIFSVVIICYLFPSATGESFCDVGWSRYQYFNIAEFYLESPPISMIYLVSSSWLPEEYWMGLSYRVDLKPIRYWLVTPYTFAIITLD